SYRKSAVGLQQRTWVSRVLPVRCAKESARRELPIQCRTLPTYPIRSGRCNVRCSHLLGRLALGSAKKTWLTRPADLGCFRYRVRRPPRGGFLHLFGYS